MFEDDASRHESRGLGLVISERMQTDKSHPFCRRGKAIFSPEIASRLIEYFATANPATREDALPELSVREREVLT